MAAAPARAVIEENENWPVFVDRAIKRKVKRIRARVKVLREETVTGFITGPPLRGAC